MQLNTDDKGFFLTARQPAGLTMGITVTVGLLYDAHSRLPMKTENTWQWLAERFAGQSWDRSQKKGRGGFAVHGKAFPLGERQQAGMAVRAQLGELEKTLHVFPPRQWQHGILGWSAKVTGPLLETPVDLEHAYGGPLYSDNPNGVGHTASGEPQTGLALPQIETQCTLERDLHDGAPLATFLPQPSQSAARRVFMGTVDEQWQRERAPWLPLDTDQRWLDEVAQDQCKAGYWKGNESWSVSGMHPVKHSISGRLPNPRPRVFVERNSGTQRIEEAGLDLDTVWLFPDAERVLLLFRAWLPVTELDGEDIVALGLACELADEPALSMEQWVTRLWPTPPVQPATIQPEAAPAVDISAAIAGMQRMADRIYESIAQAHAQALATAAKMAKDSGYAFEPAKHALPPKPSITAAPRRSSYTAPALNTAALQERITASIGQAEAEAWRLAEQMGKKFGLTSQELRRQSLANAQRTQKSLDPATVVDRLAISDEQKALLRGDIRSTVDQAWSIGTQINTAVSALRRRLSAASESAPTLAPFKPLEHWTRESVRASYTAGQKFTSERFVNLDLSSLDLTAASFRSCQFEQCNLSHTKLTSADLSQSLFVECDFGKADLANALLKKTLLQKCQLIQATLSGADFTESYGNDCDFRNAQADRMVLNSAQYVSSDWTGSNLTASELCMSRLLDCSLESADLTEACLERAQLDACHLTNANLTRANAQASSWSRVQGEDLKFIDAHLSNLRIDQASRLARIQLTGANLTEASLQETLLHGARLNGACLDRALITRCDLSDSDAERLSARSADFTGSDLSDARWLGANLLEARFRKAILHRADFSYSNLHGVSGEGAEGRVVLHGALLTRCSLPEEVLHG